MMIMTNSSTRTFLRTTRHHPVTALNSPIFLLPLPLPLNPNVLSLHKPLVYPPFLPDLHVPRVPQTVMAMSYPTLRSHVGHTMPTTQRMHKIWPVPMLLTGAQPCKWNLTPLYLTVLGDSSDVLPRPMSWVVCGDSNASVTPQEPSPNTRLVG